MLTTKAADIEIITHILTTYAYHVKARAKQNYTDESKAAEDALLSTINLAYRKNFINLNHIDENFPGIDWRTEDDQIGLQVTSTTSWEKITSTIDTVIRKGINISRCIWFVFIDANNYKPNKDEYNSHKIKTITILDLISKISMLDERGVLEIKAEIMGKLSAWIPQTYVQSPTSFIPHTYSISKIKPIRFITHNGLWGTLESDFDVPHAVSKQLKVFITNYAKLPLVARTLIAKAVRHADQPKRLNSPIEIAITKLFLHLSSPEKDDLELILKYISESGLGGIAEKNHEMYEHQDEVYISFDNYLELDWRVHEPDYNVYTALKSYYSYYFPEIDMHQAFELSNFHLII